MSDELKAMDASTRPPWWRGKMSKRRLAVIVCPLLVVSVGVLVWHFAIRRTAMQNTFSSTRGLEAYLEANGGWAVPKPPRADWLPGTVLILENGVISTYINHETLCPPQSVPRKVESAALTSFAATASTGDSADSKFLAGKGGLATTSDNSLQFTITSRSMEVSYIERPALQAAVKAHPEISKAIGAGNVRLFLITEALVSHDLEYRQNTGADAKGAAEAAGVIEAKFKGSLKGESSTHLRASVPIVIGFHATEITRAATSLGPAGDILLRDMSVDDLRAIGDSVALAPPKSKLVAATDIYVLSIGLDLYASPAGAPVGGWLEGAPASARLVAERFQSLDTGGGTVHTTLLSPTLSAGTVRPRVSAKELKSEVKRWFTSRSDVIRFMKDQGQHSRPCLFVVYCCGHGIADSSTGDQYFAPEDYISLPPSHSPSESTALNLTKTQPALQQLRVPLIVLADCCRTEDNIQKRLREDPFGGSLAASFNLFDRNFSSFMGRWPTLMYGAVVDRRALTVPWNVQGQTLQLGPLAVITDLAFTEMEANPKPFSLRAFVEMLRAQKRLSLGIAGAFCDRDPDDSIRRTSWLRPEEGPVLGGSTWDKQTRELYDSHPFCMVR